MLIKLEIKNVDKFKELYEACLVSGTYLWIDKSTILYNKEIHNIFDDIDFEEIYDEFIADFKKDN